MEEPDKLTFEKLLQGCLDDLKKHSKTKGLQNILKRTMHPEKSMGTLIQDRKWHKYQHVCRSLPPCTQV